MLVVWVLFLATCDTAGTREPDAAPEPMTTTTTEPFTPREVTAFDIPPDIHEDSWARLPTTSASRRRPL